MKSLNILKKQIKSCLPLDRYRLSRLLYNLEKKQRQNKNIEEKLLEINIYIEESIKLFEHRKNNLPKITYPENLPIVEKKEDIIEAIKKNSVIVICGETGSGKTTQLPKMCIEAGRGIFGKIGCTQPRRIAATSIAKRIKEELQVGDEVSYKIRFTSSDSNKAYIKLMTDGILLAETQNDRYLMEYDTLIIDEAHERSLNIDFILGYLKQLLKKRPELKIIISSATIDTEKFSKFFNNAPIIEVSGRLYPVEVMHFPIDKVLEERGDITVIDAAIQAINLILEDGSHEGDILIFMAAEQDIRETVDKLKQWSRRCDILPLFGRLSSAEQNKVFKNSDRRKIIVSTNIAETSLTIPGIRYVVDTGYARISRYSPRTRTQRLPIERIAQSSANQRKGRCGRVADGICIRLYSEEDFTTREVFTSPEIRRSNLAEVILRMISLRLGDISAFPFIEPPSRIAIADGYSILSELGAIDKTKQLTTLGRQMARIPIDPRTSRMLIEAQKENSLHEVLIIASALSIPDPKQRPAEKKEEADRMHQTFVDKNSDFLTFFNIWNEYQQSWLELKTQNKVRKFCNKHYLSYARMREWHDIHKQIASIMKHENSAKFNNEPASYEAIHKSILSGFLSNICSKKEKKVYVGRANKEYLIFPGSGQYSRGFPWIVACELVETSQLFARTVAKIQPEWIEPLAKNLCNYSYSNPRWSLKTQQVIADQKISLFGLVIVPEKRVSYGKINRTISRDVFISAIVIEEVQHGFDFLVANRKLIRSIMLMEDKIRKRTLLVEDDDLRDFYHRSLPDVVSVKELREFMRKNPTYCKFYMKKEDILQTEEPDIREEQFPEHIMLGNLKMPLTYQFIPVDEKDGVTLTISRNLLHQLTPEPFEWLVPGMLKDKILCFLKTLPKVIRRQMVPLAEHASKIQENLPRSHNSLLDSVHKYVQENYNLSIRKSEWQLDKLDVYLQMRFEVVDKNNIVLATSRNLLDLQKRFQAKTQDKAWHKVQKEWLLRDITTWSFDALPESIKITEDKGGIPYLGYPGLKLVNNKVDRTLFRKLHEAETASNKAISFLLSITLEKHLEKVDRSLLIPKDLIQDVKHFGLSLDLKNESQIFLRNTLLNIGKKLIRRQEEFQNKRNEIISSISSITLEYLNLIEEIVDELDNIEELLYECKFSEKHISIFHKEVKQLFPEKFLTLMILPQLKNHPRYLKCLQVRIEKAKSDFPRDEKKWQEVLPFMEKYKILEQETKDKSKHVQELVDEYQWMVHEYKISVFAQKLKTLYPISVKRLNKKLKEIAETIEDETIFQTKA